MDAIIKSMLEEERNKAQAEEQHQAAQHSQEAAAARRAQHEAQNRQYEANKAALNQQRHGSSVATLQAERTQDWYKQPIGKYQSISPPQPPRRFFGFGGSK